MRLTFVINGSQPKDIPTLVLSKTDDDLGEQPVFDAFKRMIDMVGNRYPQSMRFILKRPNYQRDNIESFMEHLKRTSNHPAIGPQDRRFDVELPFKETESVLDHRLDPFEIFHILNNPNQDEPYQITWNRERGVLAFSNQNNITSIIRSKDSHIFACFVLMTWGEKVVLINNRKGGWAYDVPGGKVVIEDKSQQDVLGREIFEELGLLLEITRLNGPVGFIYDPKSAKEHHTPVIAQYFHYPLNIDEYSYLFEAARNSTKGHELISFPLKRLIEIKQSHNGPIEALCHAPLAAVKYVQQQILAQ